MLFLVIYRHMQKAVNALRNAQKSVALGHLKLKRQLEDLLTKRLESLHTLESTLINVEGAAGNIKVSPSLCFGALGSDCIGARS